MDAGLNEIIAGIARIGADHDRRWHEDPEYRRRAEAFWEFQKQRASAASPVEKLLLCGIPQRDAELLLGGLRQTLPLLEARKFWAAKDVHLLVLSSADPGTGKTVAACWLVAQDGQPPPKFLRARELARLNPYSRDELEPYEQASLLAIDDVGREFGDAMNAFAGKLDDIVDVRYSQKRKTVLTTNLTSVELCERFGNRIADRIREAGRFVAFDELSLRRRNLPGRNA